jgi:hypothetical protein
VQPLRGPTPARKHDARLRKGTHRPHVQMPVRRANLGLRFRVKPRHSVKRGPEPAPPLEGCDCCLSPANPGAQALPPERRSVGSLFHRVTAPAGAECAEGVCLVSSRLSGEDSATSRSRGPTMLVPVGGFSKPHRLVNRGRHPIRRTGRRRPA